MGIKDNATDTIYTECPVCDGFLDLSVPRVQDDATGVIFCGALCHHEHQFGIHASPITQAEAASLERARAWTLENRPQA